MRLISLICLLLLFVGSVLCAAPKPPHTKDTIPFIRYIASPGDAGATAVSDMSNRYVVAYSAGQAIKSVTDNIPMDDLENLLVKLRASICRSTGNADITVWLSVDADGKILGVGAGAQSGLEVTFHCEG